VALWGPATRAFYVRQPQGWRTQVVPEVSESALIHSATFGQDDGVWWAGEQVNPEAADGESAVSAIIVEQRGDEWQTASFLYPPPVDPLAPPGVPEGSGDIIEPAPLLGVPAEDLPVAPPVPPPVRGLRFDPATQTGAAVGEGGSAWLRIEGGWLALPTAITTPLLTVEVLGRHEILAGGVSGQIVHCLALACTATVADVGDVQAFGRWHGQWLAVGSRGLALQGADGSWTPLVVATPEPYPSGVAPLSWLAAATSADRQWLLAEDGSIWLEVSPETMWAMGQVEQPLGLWSEDGDAIVAAASGVYRLSAP
jgi:hypothetical protein